MRPRVTKIEEEYSKGGMIYKEVGELSQLEEDQVQT